MEWTAQLAGGIDDVRLAILASGVTQGAMADVSGTMRTGPNSERYIEVGLVVPH